MSDPRSHFRFADCTTCQHAPCNRLRFGQVRPGKFVLVHRRQSPGGTDCPFAARDFGEMREILLSAQRFDVLSAIEMLINDLTPAEQLSFEQRLFIREYEDIAGRLEFLRALWQEGIFQMIRVPVAQDTDPRMREWLHSYQTFEFQIKPLGAQPQSAGRAVTDEMAVPVQKYRADQPKMGTRGV